MGTDFCFRLSKFPLSLFPFPRRTLARMAKKTVAKVGAGIPQPAVDSMFGGLTPARPDDVAPLSKAEWDEPVYIPEPARKSRLMAFQLSVSTLFFLNHHDFWVVGDLHDLTFGEIQKRRWCDLGTIAEVHRLVRSLQRAATACCRLRTSVNSARAIMPRT